MYFPNTRASETWLAEEVWEKMVVFLEIGLKMAWENTDGKKIAWERDFTDLTGEKDILE